MTVTGPVPVFTCPRCARANRHPADVAARYCGNCHAFTGALPLVDLADVAFLTSRGFREGLDFAISA